MTDLRNVWLRAADVELIRADQIFSLSVTEPGVGTASPDSLKEVGERWLMADMPGNKEVKLLSCEAKHAQSALVELANLLASIETRDEQVLFLCAGVGAWSSKPKWKFSTELPYHWTTL